MEVAAPVGWAPASRAGHRLVHGVMLGRGQLRAVVELLLLVAPEPRLARLEAAHQRVAGGRGVGAGVLGRRAVTAADVPALGASAQVEPPAGDLVALHAAGAAGWHARVESWDVSHSA